MNCTDVRDRIDDAVSGRLAAGELTGLEQHLATCAECRADYDAARYLAPATGRLPRSIEPPARVWAGVEARIARRRTVTPRLAAAAAVVLMAVSSAVTALVLGRDDAPAPAALAAPAFEASYIQQASALADLLARDRGRLAPETIETLERNLRIIDGAIAESRAALEADPADPDLRLLLRASHEQKVALLEQATRLAREL
ncbi:MAG TPA: zf-HC2 domain-containing protein [Gemmatimonadales bacterium]